MKNSQFSKVKIFFNGQELTKVYLTRQYIHEDERRKFPSGNVDLVYPTKEAAEFYVKRFNDAEEEHELGMDGMQYIREHVLGEKEVSDLDFGSIGIPISHEKNLKIIPIEKGE